MVRVIIGLFICVVTPKVIAENCLEISEQQMTQWKEAQPEMPGFGDLFMAKKIIDAERSYALKLGSDKKAHCYLGCRISEATNLETARYAAWHKEYSDATDCNPKSLFEITDYDATIKGAVYGVRKSSAVKNKKVCTEYCKKQY